jgi:hypothetical protein
VEDDDGTITAERQLSGLGAMIAFGVLLAVCLFWFLVFVTRREPRPSESEVIDHSALGGISTGNTVQLEILLGIDDYRKLKTRPELKLTCARLRQDKRRIALLWLDDLGRNVDLAWEFRRFLVGNGLTVTVRDEIEIGVGACLALACVSAARIIVLTCGPFALRSVGPSTIRCVTSVWGRAALLLSHVPAAARAQLQQKWTQHVLTLNAA